MKKQGVMGEKTNSIGISAFSHSSGGRDVMEIATAFDVTLMRTGDFQRFATMGTALRGLNRHRVRCISP